MSTLFSRMLCTVQRLQPSSKSGARELARMSLVLTMCSLAFIGLLLILKHARRNNGIVYAEFGNIRCKSVKQGLRDIDFCVFNGAQYFCTYLSSNLVLFSPDQRKPLENCLSEQESRFACREGILLCKDGIATISDPIISADLNLRMKIPQCLESTSALREDECCFFNDVPYVCTDRKPEFLAINDDISPQCIDHIVANIACSDGKFLCQKSSSKIEAVGGWAQSIH